MGIGEWLEVCEIVLAIAAIVISMFAIKNSNRSDAKRERLEKAAASKFRRIDLKVEELNKTTKSIEEHTAIVGASAQMAIEDAERNREVQAATNTANSYRLRTHCQQWIDNINTNGSRGSLLIGRLQFENQFQVAKGIFSEFPSDIAHAIGDNLERDVAVLLKRTDSRLPPLDCLSIVNAYRDRFEDVLKDRNIC